MKVAKKQGLTFTAKPNKFPQHGFHWFELGKENGDLTWLKQEWGQKDEQILFFVIVKWLFVSSLGLRKLKIPRRILFRQLWAKNLGKNMQVKKKLKPRVKH